MTKKTKQTGTSWIRDHWRPAMAVQYMIVCLFDFIIFPIGWTGLQAYLGQATITQWQPITLAATGLYHLAMGAICGVTAWTRGQEKIEMNKYSDPSSQYPQSYPPYQPVPFQPIPQQYAPNPIHQAMTPPDDQEYNIK